MDNKWKDLDNFPPLGRKLRILGFLPNQGGCAYYRIILPLRKLQEHYSNIVEVKFDENPLGLDIEKQTFKEDNELDNLHWADIVMTNNISNYGGQYTARVVGKAKEFKKLFWFDTDDLLTELYEGHHLKKVYDESLSDLTKGLYWHSDLVTVTQAKFADRVKQFMGKTILAICKNAIDYQLPCWNIDKPDYKKRPIRIGWAGGIHHLVDVKEFAAVPHLVNQKVGREKIIWDFYGRPPKNPDDKDNAWQQKTWDAYERSMLAAFKGARNYNFFGALPSDQYGSMYANMDIAIAPLQDNPFNDSKSEIKVAECGRYAVPLVASNVGCYDETIKNGHTGYLVDNGPRNKNNWVKYLTKLIKEHSHRERLGYNLKEITDEYFDINNVVHYRLDLLEYLFNEMGVEDSAQVPVQKVQPLINILTRTSNRPEYFKECMESVRSQTYENYVHVISVDDDSTLEYVQPEIKGHDRSFGVVIPKIPRENWDHFPYNTYINHMMDNVDGGWIMFLDDDDLFTSKESLEKISERLIDEDTLYIWKVEFPDKVLPSISFGHTPTYGDIASIGWSFHSKHKDIAQWDDKKAADFRCVRDLAKHLKTEWIDLVLTKINYDIGWGGSGQRYDKNDGFTTNLEQGKVVLRKDGEQLESNRTDG